LNAKQYLEQVSDLHTTVLTMQMRLQEQRYALDMLRTAMADGMPRGSADAHALENAVIKQTELESSYIGELVRWSALRDQAYAMLDHARRELSDGQAHWIGLRHIDVLEQHYIQRMSYPQIAATMRYSERTVKEYAAQALDWLDHAVDSDGYPLVPIVPE